MTTGRGFIALAALIFGKWTSVGALGSALLFGFAEALGVRLQLGDVNQLEALALMGGLGLLLLAAGFLALKQLRRGADKRSNRTIGAVALVGLALTAAARLVNWPNIVIPLQFLGLLPYVATVLALAGFVGGAIPPAAIGKPYEKA
jgi:ABC-type uncharacterized transport system permease subunit